MSKYERNGTDQLNVLNKQTNVTLILIRSNQNYSITLQEKQNVVRQVRSYFTAKKFKTKVINTN